MDPKSIPAGMHLVVRVGPDGHLSYDVRKARGFEFLSAEDASVHGYVLDARVMHRLMSRLDMPSAWFRTWHALLSCQVRGKGVIRTTHRELSAVSGISRAHLGTAMLYFGEILWLRSVKRGTYQVNPWLTFAGGSEDQEMWQGEWIAAVGSGFVIPAADHPARWRAERRAARPDTPRVVVPLAGHTRRAAETA